MMDEFIHWQATYLLLSATCDEILSWMIKTCNTIIPQTITRNEKKDVGLTFSVGDTILQFTMSIEDNKDWWGR